MMKCFKSIKSVVLCLLLVGLSGYGEIPNLMNYQGKLVNEAGIPLAGPVDLTLSIYSSSTGGSLLYGCEHPNTPLIDGIYIAYFGENTTVGSLEDTVRENDELWLEVTIDGTVLTPRERFTSVAFALRAAQADSIRGDLDMDGNTIQNAFFFGDGSGLTNLAFEADFAALEADVAALETQVDNWDMAYDWGDHGAAGYLKSDGSVALTGDLDLANHTLSNGFFSGDGSGLTNLNVTTLIENSTFITNLVNNNEFTTNLAYNSSFATTLVNNAEFTTNLAYNSTFVTNLAGNTEFTTILDGNYVNLDGDMMTGTLNMGGHSILNAIYFGDGYGLTNLNFSAFTLTGHSVVELDDITDAGSGAIITDVERDTITAITGTGSGEIISDTERDTITAIDGTGSGSIITTDERTDLQKMLDDFYYKKPTVSFSTSGGSYELGSTVSSINLDFTCNKEMADRDYSVGHVEDLGAGQNNTQTETKNITTTTTYKITVKDERDATKSATKIYTFENRTFYGISSDEFGTLSNADILSMAAKWETKGDARSVGAAFQYIYIAYPAHLGACTSFTLGGMPSSAWPTETRDVTNASGHTESFIIYHSSQKQNTSGISYDIH